MAVIFVMVFVLLLLSGIIFYLYLKFMKLPFFERHKLPPRLVKLLAIVSIMYIFLFGFVKSGFGRGFFIYLFLFYIAADFINWLLNKFAKHSVWAKAWGKVYCGGILIWVLAALISVYAYYNARHITVKQYAVTITKPKAAEGSLRVMFISDMHVGTAVQKPQLDRFLQIEQEYKPDIVLLGGDIYDEKTPENLKLYSFNLWNSMKAPHGVFYVAGNHEYSSHGPNAVDLKEISASLRAAGVEVLDDKFVFLNNSFYLAGRKDLRAKEGRLDLDVLLKNIDAAYPVILLDHQPADFNLAIKLGVDLQLSGHTHGGQFFPIGLFARLLPTNGLIYGYKKINNFQVIVTSGAGTWGFPVRVGTKSEVVILDITFKTL